MHKLEAVVGIWDGHDAGAALVIDGKTVLAVNEERLSGRKLDVGLPKRSLALVREAARDRRIMWAVTTSDLAKTLTRIFPSMKERYYHLRRRLSPPGPADMITVNAKYILTQRGTNNLLRGWTRKYFARILQVPVTDVHVVDHHAAHAATAAFWPEWTNDAIIVTLDGIGDGLSGSIWEWNNTENTLRSIASIPGSASLGLFFEHITNELQMRPLEDEGKVMALATYAAEIPEAANPFLGWFLLSNNSENLPELKCTIRPSQMAAAVRKVIWCTPREQVCRMAQQTVEYFIPQFFSRLAQSTGRHSFGYAGGVASNIKVNRLIRTLPLVAELKICPAMADGGLSLGAALYTWHRLSGIRPSAFNDFRLGSDHGDLGKNAESFAKTVEAKVVRPSDIAQLVAEKVAAGEIVMWAQGRMELGPRALGARSIVARADSVSARDDLNLRLKRRVWFQPFCPSILLSEAPSLLSDYRGQHDDNFHMTSGFLTTPRGRSALAGAIGPDGSCRPQMVPDNDNEPWSRLLLILKALTGVGAVINTSLNMHGKPMADAPEGIVAAWIESGVQHLALGSALLTKREK